MLDRLQTAFEAQREFVANASHELRTPLTVIRTEIDVTLDDPDAGREQLEATAEVVRRAIERTEGLIDRLLVLARAEGPLERGEAVHLADAVRRALDVRAADIEDQGLRVTLDLGEASVAGDPMLLDRLAGNLVDNAVDHNEADGWIEVTVAREGDAATLRCANGGPLIDADDAPRLFERFARLERARTRGRGRVWPRPLDRARHRAGASRHGDGAGAARRRARGRGRAASWRPSPGRGSRGYALSSSRSRNAPTPESAPSAIEASAIHAARFTPLPPSPAVRSSRAGSVAVAVAAPASDGVGVRVTTSTASAGG